MPLSSQYNALEKTLKIKIDGRFDYENHQEFSAAYRELPDIAHTKFIIDLSKVTYLDSTALGMLLLLRERAGGDRCDITLLGANPDTKKILDITNFQQLFKLQ
jgi:anti-anti-sigma factor